MICKVWYTNRKISRRIEGIIMKNFYLNKEDAIVFSSIFLITPLPLEYKKNNSSLKHEENLL